MPTSTVSNIRTSSSAPARMAPPWQLLQGLILHRHLISQLTRRDVLGRYRGSYLGIIWSFLNPMLLLIIFTVVFKTIFRAKFTDHPSEKEAAFAVMLFSGLIIFNVISECLSRAPSIILLNANYVTRVVFPLEILPVTVVLASLIHLLISLLPLVLGAALLLDGALPLTMLLWPLLLVPLFCWSLGLTWLLAALGVFLRDLNSFMLALTTVLMYSSAVFYPIDRVPEGFKPFIRLNPIAYLCEQSRNLAVRGFPMNWSGYGWVLLSGAAFMILGYMVFMRTKHAFADVI